MELVKSRAVLGNVAPFLGLPLPWRWHSERDESDKASAPQNINDDGNERCVQEQTCWGFAAAKLLCRAQGL